MKEGETFGVILRNPLHEIQYFYNRCFISNVIHRNGSNEGS